VLLFLKHEDDKINRVLTALAFLTAAAVTLYIFSRGATPPDTLGLRGTGLTAADFFFASFVIGLALALFAAIAALDPTSFYPRFIGAASEPESILYFRAIGQDTLPPGSHWAARVADGRERWKAIGERSDPELQELLASSFHEDARRLAHRAYHKMYRFTECNAFVDLAVMSLALLGVSRLDSASSSLRWGIIAAMLVLYSWAPMYDYWALVRQNFPDVGREYSDRPWRLRVFVFFLPLSAVSTGLLLLYTHYWPSLVFALSATALLRLLSLHGRRLRVARTEFPLAVSVLAAAVGVGVLIWLATW
jgi:hypothetical protein